MKICLIRPYSETFIVSPPFGLGYLASAARGEGHDIGIVDALLLGCDISTHVELTINAIAPYEPEVIGVQAFSCDFEILRNLLNGLCEAFPDAQLIMGGPHPSGVKQTVFDQYPQIDFAMAGEGEEGFIEWLKLLQNPVESERDYSHVTGLIYKAENGSVMVNTVSAQEDLDQWGQPAWDLMDPSIYPKAPHQAIAKGFPVAPIIATRGCPFRCTFCSVLTITGRKPRYREIDKVVDEIELLVTKYGVKEIHIEDDIFTLSKRFVMKFVEEVRRRNLKFHWHCSSGVRLDSLDEELIAAMDSIGCYNYTVAIESGSDKILKDMDKHLTTETVREKIGLLNKMGHRPIGLFMIGFPTETKKDIMDTIEFALSLNLRRAQFAIFHPLPGSPEYERMAEMGELSGLDWTKLKPEEVAFKHKHLSAGELRFLQRYAFLKFHLRPSVFFATMKDIIESGNFWYVSRRMWAYLVGGWGWPGRLSDAPETK